MISWEFREFPKARTAQSVLATPRFAAFPDATVDVRVADTANGQDLNLYFWVGCFRAFRQVRKYRVQRNLQRELVVHHAFA